MRLTWAQKQRQDWIVEMARIYGFINHEHLMKKFEISTAQAANDFRVFLKLNHGFIEYNVNAKHYRLCEGVKA
jgi:DeoR/GlpR family transcriptional regulator of sugar metabolism